MDAIASVIPYAGPAVAALIAGAISFAITVLAKDQKTSEFRQAWIDGLRADTAEFSGAASAMAAVRNAVLSREEDVEKYLIQRHDDFAKLDTLAYKIRLRLNPCEHQEILANLAFFRDEEPADRKEIDNAIEAIVAGIQVVLKGEWTRVKKGELSFRLLKLFSLGVIVTSLFAIPCIYLIRSQA